MGCTRGNIYCSRSPRQPGPRSRPWGSLGGTPRPWRRQALVAEYHRDCPEACRCLLAEGKASLHHLQVPPRPHQDGRTANLAARAFEEERRRPKVIPHLWEESGLGKLVFAVLLRVSERWGKKAVREFEQLQMRSWRQRLQLDEHQGTSAAPATDTQPRRRAASAA